MSLPDGAVSVSAYARLRGVSHTAVQQRIKAGSLPTSAKRIKGRWVIVDVDLANAEWEAHTRPYVSAGGGANGPVARRRSRTQHCASASACVVHRARHRASDAGAGAET